MSNVTKACREISELAPLARQACELFMTKCKAAGLDIFITETYRTQERQNYLYAQGRTRAGQIVTWTKNSRHTSRMAWDIACNGGILYNLTVLAKAGEIAAGLDIIWGGTWKVQDKTHFEINTNWKVPKEVDDEMIEKSKIIINGEEKVVERILKDGTNYVKIRDMAELLGYDVSNKEDIPILTSKV